MLRERGTFYEVDTLERVIPKKKKAPQLAGLSLTLLGRRYLCFEGCSRRRWPPVC
jgi:hypothetical protein